MNYLAHAHLATITNTSIVGNLLGDFVKGGVNTLPFTQEVKLGIVLHRFIDSYTDNHPYTQSLRESFNIHRRYAGIIIDVFYDHLLATQFEKIDKNLSLSELTKVTAQALLNVPETSPDRFKDVAEKMRSGNWLMGYTELDNVEKALAGISRRFKRPVDLTENMPWIRQRTKYEHREFLRFYNELQCACFTFLRRHENSSTNKA